MFLFNDSYIFLETTATQFLDFLNKRSILEDT